MQKGTNSRSRALCTKRVQDLVLRLLWFYSGMSLFFFSVGYCCIVLKISSWLLFTVNVAATDGGNVSAKISICCLRKDTLFDEHFTRIINPKEHQSFRICSHGNVASWPKLGLVASSEGRLFQLFEIQGCVTENGTNSDSNVGRRFLGLAAAAACAMYSDHSTVNSCGSLGAFYFMMLESVSREFMPSVFYLRLLLLDFSKWEKHSGREPRKRGTDLEMKLHCKSVWFPSSCMKTVGEMDIETEGLFLGLLKVQTFICFLLVNPCQKVC
ncbi:Uncharacterized protein Rs2_09373 [Raphanus sativus]|nr:Uncharacterized protein Rs2_09373 [Raphanus sativus]